MTDSRTIGVKCSGSGCRAGRRHIRVGLVLVTERDGVLHLMWSCRSCGPGWQAVTHPADKATVMASGAAIRRLGQPLGWPEMPRRAPAPLPPLRDRTAPLSRLARLVSRHPKPIEGEQ
jgi:hypothetical protein